MLMFSPSYLMTVFRQLCSSLRAKKLRRLNVSLLVTFWTVFYYCMLLLCHSQGFSEDSWACVVNCFLRFSPSDSVFFWITHLLKTLNRRFQGADKVEPTTNQPRPLSLQSLDSCAYKTVSFFRCLAAAPFTDFSCHVLVYCSNEWEQVHCRWLPSWLLVRVGSHFTKI